MVSVAPFVKGDRVWTTADYLDFMGALPMEGLLAIQKALEIVAPDADVNVLKSRAVTLLEINQAACEASSWFRYCRDAAHFDYNGMVLACSERSGIDPGILKGISTFKAERFLMEKVLLSVEAEFVRKWDRMTTEERMQVLERADPGGLLKNKVEMCNSSARIVLSALSLATRATGFSAYLLATTSLAQAAAKIGVVVPMPVYLRMTKAISLIAGPYGQAIRVASYVVQVVWENRPNALTTAAMVLTLHALKLDALKAAGLSET